MLRRVAPFNVHEYLLPPESRPFGCVRGVCPSAADTILTGKCRFFNVFYL
jgi:hypothetical protein